MNKKVIVNQERKKMVMEYVVNNYSLGTWLMDLGVWGGGNPTIRCPFHPDSRPSFVIDVEHNSYKCFSCGRAGGYLSFYHNYHKVLLTDGRSFDRHLEDLLLMDKKMQENLGFSTIFVKIDTLVPLEELAKFSYKRYAPVHTDTKSLLKIRDKLKDDTDRLLDFFADVEKGIGLETLWYQYYLDLGYQNPLLEAEEADNLTNELNELLNETGLFGEED